MQLFVVPLVIVVVIVIVCLMFNWLAHLGSRPEQLVDDLTRLNAGSWQKALTIANLLCDRQQAELRRNPGLANRLSEILNEQIEQGGLEPEQLKLRVYLCRALGVFEIEEGLPVLVKAAATQRDLSEIEVRKAAIEAIALRAEGMPNGPAVLQQDGPLMQTLLTAASQQIGSPPETELDAQLRSRAAFTLGVIGGPESRDQLARMLSDADLTVRCNATTGLARHGDTRCVERLAEMLQPDRLRQVDGQRLDDTTLTTVLRNALRATVQLAQQNPSLDLTAIQQAVTELLDDAQLSTAVRRGIELKRASRCRHLNRACRPESHSAVTAGLLAPRIDRSGCRGNVKLFPNYVKSPAFRSIWPQVAAQTSRKIQQHVSTAKRLRHFYLLPQRGP